MRKTMMVALALTLAPHAAWAKKPHKPAVTSGPSANLQAAIAMADKLAARMAQLVADAERPDLDVATLQTLVATFQKEVDDNRGQSDTLEAQLSDPEKAELAAYIQQKSTPLVARFDAAFRRLRQEDEAKKPDIQALDGLAAALTTLIADAQAAGMDAAKQAAVQQKLAAVYGQAHAVEHRLRDPASGRSPDAVTALLEDKVGARLVRVERLLRMALQPRTSQFTDTVARLPEFTARTQGLCVRYAGVQDQTALDGLWADEAKLREDVEVLSSGATLLAPDELHELRAIALSALGPVLDRLQDESQRAHARVLAATTP